MADILGTIESESLIGTDNDDQIRGKGGNDTLIGFEGDDVLHGDSGDDRLIGDGGRDTLIGGTGNDWLDGGPGENDLRGREGDDVLWGGDARDKLKGNAGSDEIRAGGGDDLLVGGADNDSLYGEDGNDRIVFGGDGRDIAIGGLGDDVFVWRQSTDGGDANWDDIIGDNGAAGADGEGNDEVIFRVSDTATAAALVAEIRAQYDGQSLTALHSINVNIAEVETIKILVDGQTGPYARLTDGDFSGSETVMYQPFDINLEPLQMDVLRGDHYALLTQVALRDDYDADTLQRFLDAHDAAWMFYADVTGREPFTSPHMLDGLGTVAVVSESCGLGCGQIGAYGIEYSEYNLAVNDVFGFTEYIHDPMQATDAYEQVAAYEAGRNFWFYDAQLGAFTGDIRTSYAVANRYLALEAAGLPGLTTFDESLGFEGFREAIMDRPYAHYLQDPTLDWATTVLPNVPLNVPGGFAWMNADAIFGGFMTRVFEDFGQEVYGAFWQMIGEAGASGSAEIATDLLFSAANVASGLSDTSDGGYAYLRKENAEDFIVGASTDDSLAAAGPKPVLLGLRGDDVLTGGDMDDLMFGGVGDDTLIGAAGDDTLVGGSGDDVLIGGDNADALFGADGQDTLFGGLGADSLTGGAGDDDLAGGDGQDVFIFRTFDGAPEAGVDTLDFVPGVDLLMIEGGEVGQFDTSGDGLVSAADTAVTLQTSSGGGNQLAIDLGLALGGDAGHAVLLLDDVESFAVTDLLF